jgi:hypothetical protein
MISFEEARRIANSHASKVFDLTKEGDEVLICEVKTVEREAGWVFYYNSRKFIQTGDFSVMLMGNAPIFINRSDGGAKFIRGDVSVDEALEQFD